MLLIENSVSAARRTRELFPANGLPTGAQIEAAFRNPAVFLRQDGEILITPQGRELSFAALVSLARVNLHEAAQLLDGPLKTILRPPDQQQLWAYLALRGARAHLPESLEWFEKGGREALSGDHLAWRTRMALREGNWLEVKNAIAGMKASMRGETAWTYWLGRSLLMTGNPEEGRILFGRISGRHDFYGLLAAEELGIPLQIPPPAAEPTQKELSQISGLPGIQRALALFRLNLRTYAIQEWLWSIRAMSDRQLLAAAELARINGIWDRAANTAAMTTAEHNFSLRYVSPYKEILLKHTRNCNLDEAVVLGLVHQESRFIADARSSAGATGLMQLMPETARLTARAIGMTDFQHSRLTRPEVNARLGTSYLRQIRDRFSANYAFAAAAYNAGPHRARKWQKDKPLEGAIYVESIPFTETRLYVEKVLANAVYYSALRGDRPLSLKNILGTIEGMPERTETAPPDR
jgi:soluble lytic murein transglycosylase